MRLAALGLFLLFCESAGGAAADACREALAATKPASTPAGERLAKEVLAAYTPNPDDFDFGVVATSLVHNNAAADVCPDGRRYIFYDPSLIASLEKRDGSKDWPKYALFAHELAHHILNHFLSGRINTSETDQKRFELAADRLAGFILAELGAGVPDAVASILAIADPEETDTHPGLCERRRAFMEGFNKEAARRGKPVYPLESDTCAPRAPGPGGTTIPYSIFRGSPSVRWTDRAEYGVYQSMIQARSPQQKLAVLDQWSRQYPKTEMEAYRRSYYFDAIRETGNAGTMTDYAAGILKQNPADLAALTYLIGFGPSSGRASAEWLDELDDAARRMVQVYSAGAPPGVSQPDWEGAMPAGQAVAFAARGWVAMTREKYQEAAAYYRQSIERDGRQAGASYFLGACIVRAKDTASYALALYHVARAVVYRGPGELPEEARKLAGDYLARAYRTYRGSDEGLADLKAFALRSATPPEGFNLVSVADIAKARAAERDELKKKDPQLAQWLDIRDELLGANGEKYFEESMKGAAMPKLRARIVRTAGPYIVAAISDGATEEVVLRLARPSRRGTGAPGDLIEFVEAVATSYNRDPFRVFFDIEAENITVLARQK